MVKHAQPYKTTICLALMFCAAAALAGDATLNTNADSGSGSLREAITAINANADPANNVFWPNSASGTLTLLSDLPSIAYATTFNFGSAIYDFTIADSTNAMGISAALTVYNNSLTSTLTIHEDIGGTGSIIKTGSGALVLTGTNTYTGGTHINGGILAADWDGALGAAAGGLSFDGGTLKILNNFYSSRAITLNALGGTFNTNSYALSLSGVISGAGGLTKKGTGTLILSGANTYLGTTTINAGTLRLGADNSIPQTSTITLASGSELDLDGHVQTAASLSGAGTLALALQPGITNLSVTGAADLGSISLDVTFSPQLIANGQTFTVLDAGSLTGQFLAVHSPALVSFIPDYAASPTDVILTAGLVPFANVAATANQQAAGAALEPLRAGASGDLAAVMGNLYVLDAAGVRAALDQSGPAGFSAMRGLAFRDSDLRSNALRSRLADLAAGKAGGIKTYSGRGAGLSYMDFDDVPAASAAEARQGTDYGPLGFFASVSGLTGKDLSDKRGGQRPGYELSGGAAQAGADYSPADWLALGVTAGCGRGKADIYFPADALVESRSRHYGAYAAASAGPLRMDLYAGRGSGSYDTSRALSFGGISRKAKGSTDGQTSSVEASAFWRFRTSTPNGLIGPFLTLNYDQLKTDPFTETGADSLNLSVEAADARSLRTAAGLRYSEAVTNGGTILKTRLSAAWLHEYKDQDLPLTATLAAGGAPFTVRTGDCLRDALKTSLRAAADFEGGAGLALEYSGEYRRRLALHLGTLTFSIKF